MDLKDISSVSKMSSFQELFALRQKKLAGKYSSPKSMALADTENAFLEKSLVKSVSNKRTLLAGKSPKNKAHKVSITEIIRSPVSESSSS